MPRARSAAASIALAGALLCGCASTPDAVPRPSSSAADPGTASATRTPTPTASPTPEEPDPVPTFDRAARSIDDPASIWVVSNKLRPLTPVDFAPADLVEVGVPFANQSTLRVEAADAVRGMFAAARDEAGLALVMQSAYRSYATQVVVYERYVAQRGREAADLTSARPGHSEHQTGLALDISAASGACTLQACFGETPEGRWLVDNAARFGFLLRYPAEKTAVTGFEYEPWHFRYVGAELSAELRATGATTLEEFFGLPPAPGYAG